MPRMPKKVGRAIERRLRRLGVKLYLNTKVEGATGDELLVSGKPIRSHTIVWTAGMANNPFFTQESFTLSRRKKVMVDEFLRAEGSKDIFVIGDNAETPYRITAYNVCYTKLLRLISLVDRIFKPRDSKFLLETKYVDGMVLVTTCLTSYSIHYTKLYE